ncbi:MAG TPA: hypothetical protein VMP12_01950 [Candidatus Sulfotelmatobacter sp.]|nr:hypothetical protein [Candidatus Sulfotelmatobacter sp.]
MNQTADMGRELLRHAVATVAYRGGKAMRGAPESFASFRIGDATRSPVKLVAHMGDLFDWALSVARGKQAWKESQPLPWDQEVVRFFGSLRKFDEYLASGEPLHMPAEKLFQGPVADALTHVGQLAMLRRVAGTPIRSENYVIAEIEVGRTGADQAVARREFD